VRNSGRIGEQPGSKKPAELSAVAQYGPGEDARPSSPSVSESKVSYFRACSFAEAIWAASVAGFSFWICS
jgi:hypothetical protein